MSLDQDPFLKKIIKLAKQNNDIIVLWLYGSQADGTAHPESDYDLAIAFEKHIPEPLEQRLRPEELAIEWAYVLKSAENKISIVDINLAPTPLAWEVLSKGLCLFARNKNRLIREELRISSEYEHDVLYHRRTYGEKS